MADGGGDRQVKALLGDDAKLEDGAVVDAGTEEPLESVREAETDGEGALADVLIIGGVGLFALDTFGFELVLVTTAAILATVFLLYMASTMFTSPDM